MQPGLAVGRSATVNLAAKRPEMRNRRSRRPALPGFGGIGCRSPCAGGQLVTSGQDSLSMERDAPRTELTPIDWPDVCLRDRDPIRGGPLSQYRNAVDLAHRSGVGGAPRPKRSSQGLPTLRPSAPWSPWESARSRTDPRRPRTGDLGCECEGTPATRLFAPIRLRSNAGATRCPRSCLPERLDGHTRQKTGRRILPEVVARRPPKAGWQGRTGHTLARDRRTQSIPTKCGARDDDPNPQPAARLRQSSEVFLNCIPSYEARTRRISPRFGSGHRVAALPLWAPWGLRAALPRSDFSFARGFRSALPPRGLSLASFAWAFPLSG